MIRYCMCGLLLTLAACAPGPDNAAASNTATDQAGHQQIDPLKAPPPAK